MQRYWFKLLAPMEIVSPRGTVRLKERQHIEAQIREDGQLYIETSPREWSEPMPASELDYLRKAHFELS